MSDNEPMQRLWSPWRMEYIEKADETPGCIFCVKPAEQKDKENGILIRGETAFIMMNAFPYNTGHLMVAPYKHTADLYELSDKEMLEISHLVRYSVRLFSAAMKPDGFNLGVNLGRPARAGFADHVHWHVVPRWSGDTNFMPVVGNTKVMPESLEATYEKLMLRMKELGDRRMTEVEERLEELRQELLKCKECCLCETATNVVFGEGNPNTPLVLVGEGLGANEDATGRPFVGRAGQLLDEVLLENGITRRHIYICNVLKCRATIREGSSIRNRPPGAEEVAACLPWLERQLDIIKPLVVMCLGAFAANVIIHKDFKMTRERGIWFTSSYANYAIAGLHPAYVLRQHGEAFDTARASLVADIGAARRKVVELKKSVKEEPKVEPENLSLF